MPRETELFSVRDAAGLIYSFLDEPHAREALLPDLPRQKVARTTFGKLLARSPRALVYVHEQYYYAEDLA